MSAVAHATEQSPPPSQGFGQELADALSMLRAFARSLCGNRTLADDLVQETILRALSNADKYKPGTNLNAWLVTILRNHFYSLARKRRREVEDVDGAIADRMVDAPRQEGQVALSEFVGALAQLPDKQRDSLILVGAYGFSYEEAAEICRARVGTIKSRVSRARSRLERVLAPASDEGVRPVAARTEAPRRPRPWRPYGSKHNEGALVGVSAAVDSGRLTLLPELSSGPQTMTISSLSSRT